MKYLKKFNESNLSVVSDIHDILTDLRDYTSDLRTNTYWVKANYNFESWSSRYSVPFKDAIRLYETYGVINLEPNNYELIIELMTEFIDIKSKLQKISNDYLIDWWYNSGSSDDGRYFNFIIKIKKHDEISTTEPSSDLVDIIKPFCDKNNYKIEKHKEWVNIDIANDGANANEREERIKLSHEVYNIIVKLVGDRIKIKDYDAADVYGTFFNSKSLRINLDYK